MDGLLFDAIAQVLGELFVNAHEENIAFSLGDLFDASHFTLSDVFLQTKTINALHLPFELVAGYIGDVKVEGLLGVVAGSPLNVSVDNVCLVLRHKQVDWDNELQLRYAKEWLVALWQSFASPATKKKAATSAGMSPAKWIKNKIVAAVADTTVQLERIHIRFESECDRKRIAYGLYIPMIRFATRDIEDQILHRRMQPGVTYPKACEETAAKLLSFVNVSFYCDLHAETFYDEANQLPSTASVSAQKVRRQKLLEIFRVHALKPFLPDQRRDLLFIPTLWVKLDLKRRANTGTGTTVSGSTTDKPQGTGVAVAAVDLVTESTQINADFAQLTALVEEMKKIAEFKTRTEKQQFRPSCVDRERVAPPTVQVISTSLFPVLTSLEALSFPVEKQCKSSAWLRGMWRYAIQSVLKQRQKTSTRRAGLFTSKSKLKMEKSQQQANYIDLYTRNLSDEAIKIIIRGRAIVSLPISPQKSTNAEKAKAQILAQLPSFVSLTMKERWEYSDLIQQLSVSDQRMYRAMADNRIRDDYAASMKPESPSKRTSSNFEPLRTSFSGVGSFDGTRTSPKRNSTPAQSFSSEYSPELPVGFISNHHQATRSMTESAFLHKQDQAMPATPTQAHGLMYSDGNHSPTKNATTAGKTPHLTHSKRMWVQETIFPPSMVKKPLPLINWSLGPITLNIQHASSVPSILALMEEDGIVTRESFMEIGFESCKGAILICKSPDACFLVEMRFGLFHATLFSQSQNMNSDQVGNGITTDYIHLPENGFLYVGLKYNRKNPSSPTKSTISRMKISEEEWELVGKVSIGPIKIDYNELTLQTALLQSTEDRYSQGFLITTGIPRHTFIIDDVFASWKRFLDRFRRKKVDHGRDHPSILALAEEAAKKKHARAAKKARFTKLLNVLLMHPSTLEVEASGVELNLSLLTNHLEEALGATAAHSSPGEFESVNITLPSVHVGMQNRPDINECQVDAAGARANFRTTKHGRTAVSEYLLHRVCGLPETSMAF